MIPAALLGEGRPEFRVLERTVSHPVMGDIPCTVPGNARR